MTILSLLSGDWTYEFEDERVSGPASNAGTKMLRYVSGPVRETVTVYSALAEAVDDFIAMGFDNPMIPVKPNQFTMESQAFIARRSTEFLKEGTIIQDGTIVGTEGVIRKRWSGCTAPVVGDIGREVVETTSSDTGTLLDFETEADGTTIVWIRPNDASADTFSLATALTATGGTMVATGIAAETDGINRHTAFQAIGSVPTATEVYVYQDRVKLTDQDGGFQWWVTDPNVSLGIVSTLVRTMTTDVAHADQDLEVFARRYTSLYDNFRLNVAAGGFSALPLASAPDINNTTGYFSGAWDAGTGSAMLVGDVITNTFSGKTGGRYVVTAVADSGATGTLEWYEAGDLTAFANDDTFTSPNRNGTLDGAPTATVDGPTETGAGNGATVTITLGNTTRDHDNTGVAEPYSIIVDAQSLVPIATVYEVIKYRTRRGADEAALFGAGINVPGESYRGLDGLFYYDDLVSGPFGEGEDILVNAGTWTARSMSVRTAITGEGVGQIYFTTTDQQTSLDSAVNDDQIDDEGGSNVDVDTGGAGGAILAITSPKSSPLGTFTGTQIFGAQGVDFRNPNGADTKAYILVDDLGTQRSPPNTIAFIVTNTRAGDRIYVARDTGTPGVIDKDQFGGMTAVAASSKTITVGDAALDAEVPTVGFLRVVENALLQEHKYDYASRDISTGIFSLVDITAASADSGTSDTVLDKTGGPSFVTEGVTVGMLIFVSARTSTYEVTGSITADTLAINLLYGAGGFVSGDAFTINETIQLYATSDDIFDLLIDFEEDTGTDGTPGSIQNTLVKTPAADFDVVVQVRLGKTILPFEQNQTVADVNVSVTAVRTPDTVAV